MKVDSVQFETMADSPAPEWTIRVTAKGSGFDSRAALLRASVGGVVIEGLIPSGDGTSFSGYLREAPPMGAPLVVGFHEAMDTGLTFQGTT